MECWVGNHRGNTANIKLSHTCTHGHTIKPLHGLTFVSKVAEELRLALCGCVWRETPIFVLNALEEALELALIAVAKQTVKT